MPKQAPSDFWETEDILIERRGNSDLRWAVKEWEEDAVYKYKKQFIRKRFLAGILESDRVKNAIEKETLQGANSRKDNEAKVKEILDEMCHKQDISVIRKFAVPLTKTMKRIYNKITINQAGIEMIKKVSTDVPVVFLPTHRSYADFLLISYIAFHYNLALPIIAAGMDFMSMAIIGDMLRGAGAFYIKRSFVNDSLYWAVFQEFVEVVLRESGQPLEFFLEGTRSRSGKTLPPKLGLLGCVLGCWLRGSVPDVAMVPISISYERTLEETLYGYELLGVPKPKESTSGLLKAMKILKEDFGDVHVRVGQVVFVSDFFGSKVGRHLNVCPSQAFSLSPKMLEWCDSLAVFMSRRLQNHWVVSVWSLTSIILLQRLRDGHSTVPLESLRQQIHHLFDFVRSRGAMVACDGSKESVDESINKSYKVHSNIVQVQNDVVNIQLLQKTDSASGLAAPTAVLHLMLQHYVNQIIHWFIYPCLVLLAAPGHADEVYHRYLRLLDVFCFDFIFDRKTERQDFLSAMQFLEENEVILSKNEKFEKVSNPSSSENRKGNFVSGVLQSLIQPFLFTYSVALQVVDQSQVAWKKESDIVMAVQAAVGRTVSSNRLYSSLSLDTCRHSIKMLIKTGAVSTYKSPGGAVHYSSNHEVISRLQELFQEEDACFEPLQSKL